MRSEQRDSQVEKYELLAFTGGSRDIKTVLVNNSLLKTLTFWSILILIGGPKLSKTEITSLKRIRGCLPPNSPSTPPRSVNCGSHGNAFKEIFPPNHYCDRADLTRERKFLSEGVTPRKKKKKNSFFFCNFVCLNWGLFFFWLLQQLFPNRRKFLARDLWKLFCEISSNCWNVIAVQNALTTRILQ